MSTPYDRRLEAVTRIAGVHGALLAIREDGIPVRECDFSLTQVYGAQEAFCTGTYSGILPVREVDGRDYALPGPITTRLRSLYEAKVREPDA